MSVVHANCHAETRSIEICLVAGGQRRYALITPDEADSLIGDLREALTKLRGLPPPAVKPSVSAGSGPNGRGH
jgi:hypothetical protein